MTTNHPIITVDASVMAAIDTAVIAYEAAMRHTDNSEQVDACQGAREFIDAVRHATHYRGDRTVAVRVPGPDEQ